MAKTPAPPPRDEPFQALLDRFSITTWDLVLIGDGSGSQWGLPVGWACVAIEKAAMTRRVFYGALNNGTVNMAELLAYLAPLSWYTSKVGQERSETRDFRARHIHILTDSEYVKTTGSSDKGATVARNTILWGALQLIERRGFILHWHWLPREDAALNHYVDVLSKAARQQVKNLDLVALAQEKHGLDPEAANPS